jgi:hypothetical protein
MYTFDQDVHKWKKTCEINEEISVKTASSHLVVIPMAMLGPPILIRAPSRRRLAVHLWEWRVLRCGHSHLPIRTMGVHHIWSVRLGSVRKKRRRIELRRLRIPLLFSILPMSIVVGVRNWGDVELRVVSRGLSRLGSRWGRKLPIEPRRIAYRSRHVGRHRRRHRRRGHAWSNRHALLLGRVERVDVGACATSMKVRMETGQKAQDRTKRSQRWRKMQDNVARKTKTHLCHRASCRGHVSHPFSSPFAESRRTLQRCRI